MKRGFEMQVYIIFFQASETTAFKSQHRAEILCLCLLEQQCSGFAYTALTSLAVNKDYNIQQ